MNSALDNKQFLILGAAGLLGAKVVKAVLEQGAKVVAADLSVENLNSQLLSIGVDIGSSAVTLEKIDIMDEESVVELMTKYRELDGAVNLTYPRNKHYGKHFFDVSVESFNDNVNMHLGSAFMFIQQCASYFKKHNRPFSLVNFSSIYGVVAPKFNIYENTSMTTPVEYAAIKSAIQHLTKYVVKYIGDSSFRANCISPGGIFNNQPDSFVDAYKKETNSKGMLDANDLMGGVIFLLSEQSKYVTGQNIIVDDGFTL